MYPAQFLPVMIIMMATFFGSEAQASSLVPTYLAPIFSAPFLKADFKCERVDGKLVCGGKKSHSKKNDDDDDDDDRPKKKKGGDAELEECTIQQPGGGGGCKGGFKRVCEKMKSGKKCCGCVVDKNAEPANQPPAQQTGFICESDVVNLQLFAANEAEARSKYDDGLKARKLTPKGPVTCTKIQ